jgi:hypothetical protein
LQVLGLTIHDLDSTKQHPLLPSFFFHSSQHSYLTTTPASAPAATFIPTTYCRSKQTYSRRLNLAYSLTQSGAFTDDLHTQSPNTLGQQPQASTKRIHQPPNPTYTHRRKTQPSASQLPHVTIYSRNTIPKHILHQLVTKPRNCLSGLSHETTTLSRRFQNVTTLSEEEHNHTQAKMSSPKRRIETDVMKMLMSDYEVTLVNDNMQEFYVRFKGPEESKLAHTVNRSRSLPSTTS